LLAAVLAAIILGVVLGGPSKDDNMEPALTEDGIHLHLKDHGRIRIMSGAIHYFRLPEETWRDRLLKLKATGANTVETYMSWNLHEPKPGQFDFSGNLNIAKFIELADEVGLLFILRPGPYICSEWDFGGLPAWLLSDYDMRVRSTYPGYQEAAKRFLDQVYDITKPYMRTTAGGPIILIQLENEYNGYHVENNDPEHLRFLEQIIRDHGIKEKVFTSDGYWDIETTGVDDVWATINFDDNYRDDRGWDNLARMDERQPGRPTMVTEYWSGWFDHWGEQYTGSRSLTDFSNNLGYILDHNNGSSVNMYMFFGGTNFGWMNGANSGSYFEFGDVPNKHIGLDWYYKSDTSSYDYDAPLSEAGHMTEKFLKAREMISAALGIAPPSLEGLENEPSKAFAPPVYKNKFIKYERLVNLVDHTLHTTERSPIFSELLKIHGNTGQSYGYTNYANSFAVGKNTRKVTLSNLGQIKIHDSAEFYIVDEAKNLSDRELVWFMSYDYNTYDRSQDSVEIELPVNADNTDDEHVYMIVIRAKNFGRVNYGSYLNEQRKGVHGELKLDGKTLTDWVITPLEFDFDYVTAIEDLANNSPDVRDTTGAHFYEFDVDTPTDTYLGTENFQVGQIFLNGKNLGRYHQAGPQRALYIPKQWLTVGTNKIMVFEENIEVADTGSLYFLDKMLYKQDMGDEVKN